MSFSEFQSIPEVQLKYQLQYLEQQFILPTKLNLVSTTFQTEFDFNLRNIDVFVSEAARCESIIFPILREIYKLYAIKLSLWVQKSISVDAQLTGIPDYLISKRSDYGKLVLETPLLALVEAKKNDFQQGWGQCLAELVAAQKLNKNPNLAVYGIVTDGNLWEFAYLVKSTVIKNLHGFSMDNLPKLFAALDYIFQQLQLNS